MRRILILCDEGKIGTYKQCQALAHMIQDFSSETHVKTQWVKLPWYLSWMPPHIGRYCPPSIFCKGITTQNFDLLIVGGRRSVLPALAFRNKVPTIMLMDPKINASNFSLVIAPQHDNLKGDNVISILGSLHVFKPHETLHTPILSVFLGGDSAHYTYTHGDIERLSHVIENELASKQSISVCITPSRRTQKHWVQILRERFSNQPVEIWDGTGENPYVHYLNQAHKIIVTGDSISMMSEVCRMGVPVYIFDVAIAHPKFKHFKQCLIDQNHARFISDPYLLPAYTPRILDECTRIRPEIGAFMRLHFDS